jgi:NAD(P)-dependent dehydrogenase (short-subunit alcohol dehydrogenase family)
MVNDSRKAELVWWLDAHRRYFARQAAREGFELDSDILMVFERFEVVEIKARAASLRG